MTLGLSSSAMPHIAALFTAFLMSVNAFGASPTSPSEASTGPQQHAHIEVELVSEFSAFKPGSSQMVGLALRPEHHWHTYWKNPGDSGLAPALHWALPTNFSHGDILWGTPERIDVSGITNFGYDGDSLLMVPLDVPEGLSEGPYTITLDAEWLVCKEACIPGDAQLTLTLPMSESPELSQHAELFEHARKALPALDENAQAHYQDQGEQLVFQLLDSAQMSDYSTAELQLFVADESLIAPSSAPLWNRANGVIQVAFEKSLYFHQLPEATEVVLAVAHQKGWQIQATQGPLLTLPQVAQSPSQVADYSLVVFMIMALVGGLLLNLMPCVFPVLSLKAVSLVKLKNADASDARKHGLLYLVGIELSLLALTLLLMLLKQSGTAVGWGFQLQEPLFLAVLSALMMLMGLSLMGAFELAGGWMSIGQKQLDKGGASSSLLSGVLAVVVASPCMTPFMAPALGAALVLPPLSMIAIIMSLGFGLALPLVLLSYFPAWSRWLPKPGRWLETFKQAMAFPLFFTSIWLLWLLLAHDAMMIIGTLVAVVCLCFLIWLYQRGAKLLSLGFTGVVSIFLVVVFGAPAVHQQTLAGQAEPYSKQALAQYIAQGQPVLINMTADWCLTCKVNEKVTFSDEDVSNTFGSLNVVYMVGDWTRRDAEISKYLDQYKRAGVPLYVLYDRHGEDQVLPQVLTPQGLINRLEAL
ncbi:protein-disulfide reductase DsbD family protein [Echinimonas agarilytica]|uniref:Thioredoxin family protein n=1 Tax=Echinimonas agarilytica TaxID=1215918 RepID=A0AA42B7G2_9GAMM|nr:protein-disulfide reductase DsbD domain-containing protein [Echinimonas agarilytica]MCM2679930.1 thioredoxin family protein [Echinimonas agarilytica]